MREDPSAVNVQGQLALTLLAVDPVGLGGLHLRARAGPVRDMFCAPIKTLFPKARRIFSFHFGPATFRRCRYRRNAYAGRNHPRQGYPRNTNAPCVHNGREMRTGAGRAFGAIA